MHTVQTHMDLRKHIHEHAVQTHLHIRKHINLALTKHTHTHTHTHKCTPKSNIAHTSDDWRSEEEE